MRANEFITESPQSELADQLPDLPKHDYDTIDKLMTAISDKHGITGKKLHDLFVDQYDETPDDWIKHQLSESITLSKEQKIEHIQQCIRWCYNLLNIEKPYPKFTLSYDTEEAQGNHHTGSHHGNSIWIYVKNRSLVDILRTVIHELTHERQMQLGMIKDGDSYPGSPIEMLADMVAGKYIKIWGKKHPEIFQ